MTSQHFVQPTMLKQIDLLKVETYPDRRQMGKAAGLEVAARLKLLLASQQRVNVVFAAAPSQNEFLETLASVPGIEWDRVAAMHMDEYVGLPEDADQRFGNYLRAHIFSQVNPGQIYYLDGNAADLAAECRRYSQLLRDNPVDIVCAGIGENGHLAFNDPGIAGFIDTSQVKLVALEQASRQQQVNDGCFADLSQVPTQALTLTVPALMAGRWLYCVVPGPTKAEAVRLTLESNITQNVPASILRVHPRAVLYIDQDSGSKLTNV